MNSPGPVDPFLKAFQPLDTLGWIAFVSFSFIVGLTLVWISLVHPNVPERKDKRDLVSRNMI